MLHKKILAKAIAITTAAVLILVGILVVLILGFSAFGPPFAAGLLVFAFFVMIVASLYEFLVDEERKSGRLSK